MAITLRPIAQRKITFGIEGTSPMIHHAWSEKGLQQMRLTATERKKIPKKKRDPEGEALAAMYQMPDGSPAFPLLAFKSSLISAAHKDVGLEKTLVRKAFFLPAVPNMLVPLEASPPVIREDIVRLSVSSTDIRYRMEFAEWRVSLEAVIDYDLLNEENVINLVNRAGFGVGVCEWRPEKGGEFGRYKIDGNVPVKICEV